MVKLYPEGNAEAQFTIGGVQKIYFYCNRDGLFHMDIVKGLDDRESGYDDTQERRELEAVAKMLFSDSLVPSHEHEVRVADDTGIRPNRVR